MSRVYWQCKHLSTLAFVCFPDWYAVYWTKLWRAKLEDSFTVSDLCQPVYSWVFYWGKISASIIWRWGYGCRGLLWQITTDGSALGTLTWESAEGLPHFWHLQLLTHKLWNCSETCKPFTQMCPAFHAGVCWTLSCARTQQRGLVLWKGVWQAYVIRQSYLLNLGASAFSLVKHPSFQRLTADFLHKR